MNGIHRVHTFVVANLIFVVRSIRLNVVQCFNSRNICLDTKLHATCVRLIEWLNIVR